MAACVEQLGRTLVAQVGAASRTRPNRPGRTTAAQLEQPLSSSLDKGLPSCTSWPPRPQRTEQSGWRTGPEPRALREVEPGLRNEIKQKSSPPRTPHRWGWWLSRAPVYNSPRLAGVRQVGRGAARPATSASLNRAAGVHGGVPMLTIAQLHQRAERVLALGPVAARSAGGTHLQGSTWQVATMTQQAAAMTRGSVCCPPGAVYLCSAATYPAFHFARYWPCRVLHAGNGSLPSMPSMLSMHGDHHSTPSMLAPPGRPRGRRRWHPHHPSRRTCSSCN